MLRTLVFVAAILAIAGATPALGAPGEVTNVQWCGGPKSCLLWTPVAGATQYRLFRGEWASLPCALSSAVESCDDGVFASSTTGAWISEVPASGRFFWFLVIASDASGSGSPGLASAGLRQVNDTGACAPSCALAGQSCSIDADCCSPNCVAGTCQSGCCQATGSLCTQSSDCCIGICGGNQCQAPSCTDGVKNGSETDVDCGGTCPNRCASGQGCAVHTDCVSGACSPLTLTCAITCQSAPMPGATCASYCDCMIPTCPGVFVSMATCLDACSSFYEGQLCCRAYACNAAMSDPQVHCPHAAGFSLCP